METPAKKRDVLLIGGGHNGLVCAAYLARAGLQVTVLERRGVVGGAAVTEEFHPGFRNSVASYTVSLLQPRVIDDLGLHGHGLRIVQRRRNNFLPLPDGSYLLTGAGRTAEEVAKFSRRDAGALPAYEARLDAIADVLRALALQPPPNVTDGGWWKALPELLRGAKLGRRLHALDETLRQGTAGPVLHFRGRVPGPLVRERSDQGAVRLRRHRRQLRQPPYAPGSAYVLLHHVFGEVNGVKGAWGHAIGGMGAITQAMARAAVAAGVEIRTDAGVREVLVEHGRAVGVVTAAGETLRARAVVANVNPKLLYQQLLPATAVPAATAERMRNWRCGSGTFRMNVALSRLPDFSALPGEGDHLTAGIILAPSLDYMDRAWRDAREHGWSREPIVEMLIPSTLDDSLAPPGMHVASLFCQHVAPELPWWPQLGRPPRGSRRPDGRHGGSLCAGFRRFGTGPAGAQPAGPGARVRPWSAATSSTAR